MINKNRIDNMILCLSVIVICGWMFGCVSSKKPIVRYQSVSIPEYDRKDYEELLTSEDRDVKYNAICNLIPYASKYADVLGKDSSENKPVCDGITYDQAQHVLETIRLALQNHNENIKAASLIFLSEFSSNFCDKKALFELVSQVRSNDVRTQYEQIKTMLPLVDAETEIETSLIQGFLNSRSWLIRSMTYRLLGKIVCEEFHPQLLLNYKNTTQEYDKLLIVYAFQQQYGPEVFTLLSEELLLSPSRRIQMAITDILPGNRDNTAAGEWLAEHCHQLNEDVLIRMINRYASELRTSGEAAFFDIALDADKSQLFRLIAKSRFFESLYAGLAREDQNHDLIGLRDAVHHNNDLNEAWKAYKDKKDREHLKEEEEEKREDALKKAILPKYTEMLKTFLAESKRLFADAGMDAEEIEKTTKDMRELLQVFQEEQEKESKVKN